ARPVRPARRTADHESGRLRRRLRAARATRLGQRGQLAAHTGDRRLQPDVAAVLARSGDSGRRLESATGPDPPVAAAGRHPAVSNGGGVGIPSAMTDAPPPDERPENAVVIFAPLPVLTVTIEDRSGEADIHVHAGGQGVWQSRMLSSLGVPVVLCAAVGGETGDVLGHLLPIPDVTVRTVPVSSRNGAYVHDRRTGERQVIAESPGSPLDRHELDSLYELTLTEGLKHGRVLLS